MNMKNSFGDTYNDSLIIKSYRKKKLKDAKRKYYNTLSANRYGRRDSFKLIVAQKKYRDAIRKYNDSVIDSAIEKAKALGRKIINGLNAFKEKFPGISKVISTILALSGVYDTYKGAKISGKVTKTYIMKAMELAKEGNHSTLKLLKAGLPKFLGIQLNLFFKTSLGIFKMILATHLA